MLTEKERSARISPNFLKAEPSPTIGYYYKTEDSLIIQLLGEILKELKKLNEKR